MIILSFPRIFFMLPQLQNSYYEYYYYYYYYTLFLVLDFGKYIPPKSCNLCFFFLSFMTHFLTEINSNTATP